MSVRLLASRAVLALAVLSACSLVAQAQPQSDTPQTPAEPEQAAPPAAGAPDAGAATAATGQRTPIMARVIEVRGDAKWKPLGADELKPVQVDDEYPEGTQIVTGVRSQVKLAIGLEEPYTAMLIDSMSSTILSEAAITPSAKRVRVGVGYGRVRAGVAEGGLESDFTIDSPVATLSKRGTWNFTLYYERDTDIFEIGLLDSGLITAINRVTGQQRTLTPRELVTEAMRRWLDQAEIERNVAISDLFGQEDIEIAFNRLTNEGLGVIDPGSGRRVLLDLSNLSARTTFSREVQTALGGAVPIEPIDVVQPQLRPEGFFGTGRGDQLIDVIIDGGNPMAQRGFARPGHYRFRRSALENWMQRNRPD